MQAKIPTLLSANVESAPSLDQVLTPEAVHRAACAQSALVLLTQFSSNGEVFISDVAELAAYIDGPGQAVKEVNIHMSGAPDEEQVAAAIARRVQTGIQ